MSTLPFPILSFLVFILTFFLSRSFLSTSPPYRLLSSLLFSLLYVPPLVSSTKFISFFVFCRVSLNPLRSPLHPRLWSKCTESGSDLYTRVRRDPLSFSYKTPRPWTNFNFTETSIFTGALRTERSTGPKERPLGRV